MDAAGIELADRMRAVLSDEPTLDEKQMFGMRIFMVGGKILVGAGTGGRMLVRVTEEHGAALLDRPGAEIAVMGPRSMGTGWLEVTADALAEDDALMFWIDVAREDNPVL